MGAAAQTRATEANQKALITASQLQLNVLTEQNQTIGQQLKEIREVHLELQTDKELLESFIAAMDAKIEQLNLIAETFIKLHQEMAAMYEEIQQHTHPED